ncbi:MAG: prolyl oligopeptidase family serine peptidase, partial [Clostridiales bacterium]|nr:prolyl oligopeptidase family serine peptidase [Clostridiales bacterium]
TEPEETASSAPFSEEPEESDTEIAAPSSQEEQSMETGIIAEQILEGETGTIHYSYYLPEHYDPQKKYPLMMAMPGYDRMWFGEESSGSNLSWDGFLCWTELPEEMIVVSAQLTDWHETSARQAIELTEYFIDHFSVDQNRIYAAGYSAGGETMSQAVAMRPDLYAAYLHGASQWDGDYAPVAQNGVAVYIFMAEHDEYYGPERARSAYSGLHDAYIEAGWSEEQIGEVLQIQTPDDEWFAQRGITGNYHGGGNAVFGEEDVLNWVLSHAKEGDVS